LIWHEKTGRNCLGVHGFRQEVAMRFAVRAVCEVSMIMNLVGMSLRTTPEFEIVNAPSAG
jgi:hypothetical protein